VSEESGSIDLDGLLADPMAAGAYFVDANRREVLPDAAARLGFACTGIDLGGCTDKDGVLSRIAAALGFPDWFGGNWDALADCLHDLSWWPAEGYVIVLDQAQHWRQADPDGFDQLLEIADEAATAWAARDVPFWWLVPVSRDEIAP
jgi:RNAse (barnase) inhibitor barstar